MVDQMGDFLKEEFQDLVILAQYTLSNIQDFFFPVKFLLEKALQIFFFTRTFKVRIKVIWCKKWMIEAKMDFWTHCILSSNQQILIFSLLLTIFLPSFKTN